MDVPANCGGEGSNPDDGDDDNDGVEDDADRVEELPVMSGLNSGFK